MQSKKTSFSKKNAPLGRHPGHICFNPEPTELVPFVKYRRHPVTGDIMKEYDLSSERNPFVRSVLNSQIQQYTIDKPKMERDMDEHRKQVRAYQPASAEEIKNCLSPDLINVQPYVSYYKDPYTGEIKRGYTLPKEDLDKYLFENGKIVEMKPPAFKKKINPETMVYNKYRNEHLQPRGANYDDLTYLLGDYPTVGKETFKSNTESKDYYDGLSTNWALLDRINTYSSGSTNKQLNELKLQTYDMSTNVRILDDNYRFKYIKPIDMDGKKRQKFMNFMPQE